MPLAPPLQKKAKVEEIVPPANVETEQAEDEHGAAEQASGLLSFVGARAT